MRKEIIYAVILGIAFGLVVAFGVWKTNRKLNEINKIESSPKPSPSSAPITKINISIAKPYNFFVSDKSIAILSGITSPEVWVAISTESNYYLVKSGTNGIFQQDVNLADNVNEIICTAFDTQGKSASDSIIVVYSPEFITVSDSTPKASTSSGDIREKVQAKVEEKLKKPVAFIGTATDISEGTIQITELTNKNEIKQISVSAETVYTKNAKNITKTVKFADMAIGDFVVAMGYVNGNSVLATQQVLITDPVVPTKRSAFMMDNVTINKNIINGRVMETGKEIIIKKLDTKTKLDKLTDADRIIVVGTLTEDYLEARKIFLI